jgi:hypothetical protein
VCVKQGFITRSNNISLKQGLPSLFSIHTSLVCEYVYIPFFNLFYSVLMVFSVSLLLLYYIIINYLLLIYYNLLFLIFHLIKIAVLQLFHDHSILHEKLFKTLKNIKGGMITR